MNNIVQPIMNLSHRVLRYVPILLLLFPIVPLFSQVEVRTDRLEADDISVGERLNVIESVKSLMSDYYLHARLFDQESQQINDEAKQRFLQLHTDDGVRIYNDLIKKGVNGMSLQDYMALAEYNLGGTGVEFDLSDIQIVKIARRGDQGYRVTMEMTKLMYQTIEKGVKKSDQPREVSLTMKVNTGDDTYSFSRINDVSGVERQQTARVKERAGVSIYGGYGIGATALSTVQTALLQGEMSFDNASRINIGADLHVPLGASGRLNGVIGGGLGLYNLTNTMSTEPLIYNGKPVGNVTADGMPIHYQIQYAGYDEEIDITKFEGHLGVSYTLGSSQDKWELHIEGVLMPSMTFVNDFQRTNLDNDLSLTSPVINGVVLSDVGQFVSDPSTGAPLNSAYQNLWRTVVGNASLADPNLLPNTVQSDDASYFNLAARLSPLFYHRISRQDARFYFLVGLDITADITNFMNMRDEASIGSPFDIRPPEEVYSLSQYAFSDYRLLTVGGRAGIKFFFRR